MMTNPNQAPPPQIAAGYNPEGLSEQMVRTDIGWYLLNEGDTMQPGDGWFATDWWDWIDYECRCDYLKDGIVKHFAVRRKAKP